MPEVYTTLKGPPIGQSTLSPQLKSNVITFFNWGLLGKGAFFNVSLSQAGPYGGDESRLRLVDDPIIVGDKCGSPLDLIGYGKLE